MTAAGEPFRVVHEGETLEGFVLAPSSAGPHPAVLMYPGATGPGRSFVAAARELADLGYLVVSVDMYGVDADISTPQAAGAHFVALLGAPERLRARVLAWFDAVCERDDVDQARIAAIGYCFGGRCVLELARSGAAVRCVTSFHGLLKTHAPALPGAIQGKVAVWTAGRDPYVPAADLDDLRAELEGAEVDYQITVFNRAEHGFTDPDHDGFAEGISYNATAHRVSWSGTLALLQQCLT